jgi:tetratricopeptide (TPR) repeat protein
MNRRGSLWVVVFFVAVGLVAGCHRDPNVRKQKYMESGNRYSEQGKYREAAIQYMNALKVDKSFPDAHYALAQSYMHLGQLSAAYGELTRTVDLQPTNYKARIDLGNLLIAGGKIDDAQKQADAVKAALPDNPDLHAMLSAIAVKRGQRDLALTEMSRALQLEPSRAAFHEDFALLQSSDPTKVSAVEDELRKAVALDQKSVSAKLMLAAFYARSGRLQDAEKTGWAAVATDPKSISARASLAQIVLKEGDQPRAEEVLRQASKDLADNPQGVRMLADYYEGSGQMEKAKTEFAALAAKYPKSASVQKGYVRLLLQVKDFATARTVVDALLKKGSKDPEVVALNGIVLLNDGKASDAVDALSEGAKNYPKDAFIQFWLGKAAQAKGDPGLAEKSFRQAEELAPSRLDAPEELARIAAMRGDLQLLEDVANKTIAASPRFPGGYVWRAIVEMNHNSADKAEDDLKTAMSVAPQSPQAYVQLGKIRFSQKRFPEGVALLEQALLYDPNSFEAIRLIIDYDLFAKHPDQALARLNAQIEKSPRNSSYYDLLAQLQVQNKNMDQAVATTQKAMQLNPADGEAVMMFAQLQVMRGQAANAIGAWEKWLVTHPNDAGAIALLGTLEESRGDLVKAEAYYKKSLQIQPQQPIAANNLAYRMLQNGGNIDVALTLAQTARQAMPNSASTADTLAWAYYYKGTYSFARDLLEDAIKAKPDDATMQYHLGMVYGKLNDKANAALHLKKAVSLAPDSPVGKDAQTALHGLG